MDNYYEDHLTDSQKQTYAETGKANAFLRQVYVIMAFGLGITGVAAWFFGGQLQDCVNVLNELGTLDCTFGWMLKSPMNWILTFAPLGFVLALSFGIHKMSYQTSSIVFGVYSFVMGMSLSYIFITYTGASIFKTFFITAGTFGAMSVIGLTTKVDLTKFGSILYMALIGLIIASVVNWFMQSEMMDYIISFIGIGLFCGLTAYDTQRLMQFGAHADMTNESVNKASVMGALALYLDFINLFLFLLRFFGSRE